jgi:hypothetical protein
METFNKITCFNSFYGECIYRLSCPHSGSYLFLQTPDNSLKHPELFTPNHEESSGDMENFLMLKKVFSLRETGYWRS